MVIVTASIHDNTEPTFVSKRQWVPRRPPKFRILGGRQKKFFALTRWPRPPKTCTKSPPMTVIHALAVNFRFALYWKARRDKLCQLLHYIQSEQNAKSFQTLYKHYNNFETLETTPRINVIFVSFWRFAANLMTSLQLTNCYSNAFL